MPLSMDEIMARIPEAFLQQGLTSLDAVVHIKFTGDEAGEWNAVIRDGKCEIARGLPRIKPTITLISDSADFQRVLAGELSAAKAFMEGKVKLTGDTQLALKLVQLFTGQ